MNFTDINMQNCRIMWSQRDPSLRKSGVGNVFVKNLPANVDNKGLFDTFSVFGNILSCKVATQTTQDVATGQSVVSSKGYGYVHYETADAAQDAIQKFNGMMIEDSTVTVDNFVPSKQRVTSAKWTNLFVKQFPLEWAENELVKLFEPYGDLASVKIERTRDEVPVSKGFGFVAFVNHESAAAACDALNTKVLHFADGAENQLFVSRHQKRADRARDLQRRQDEQKIEKISKFQGMNIYVKNLCDELTDDEFREAFAPFGTITSARIMRNGDVTSPSKGFGFVCFSTIEEANRAMAEMNGKPLPKSPKPMYVALHQRKEHRRQVLEATYGNSRGMRNFAGQGMQMGPFFMPQPNFNPRGAPFQYPQQGGFQQRAPRAPGGFGGRGNGASFFPYYNQQQMGPPRMGRPQSGGLMQQQQQQTPMGIRRGLPNAGMGMPQPQRGGGGRGAYGYTQPQPSMGVRPQQQQQRQGAGVFNQGVRVPPQHLPMGMQPAPEQMHVQELGSQLNPDVLARADAQQQKNMIGERLYPLIFEHQPQLAGKITGMLLEMDNAELLNLIESADALHHKIEEALVVLKNHQQEGERE